jgi:suppressor of G2 allele of SKP1
VITNPSGKYLYSWYQTTNTVVLELRYKLLNPESLKVNYEEKKLSVALVKENSADFELNV